MYWGDPIDCIVEVKRFLLESLFTILTIIITTATLFIIVMFISSPINFPRHEHHSTLQGVWVRVAEATLF